MSNMEFAFVLIGITWTVAQLFRVIDVIEKRG